MSKVLYAPLLTEKAAQAMDSGLYVISVSENATKKSIRQEFKTNFDLDVVSVRIVNLPAKQIKFKRIPGTQPARRKAYVQLKKGQKLPGFELRKQKEEKTEKETVTEKS